MSGDIADLFASVLSFAMPSPLLTHVYYFLIPSSYISPMAFFTRSVTVHSLFKNLVNIHLQRVLIIFHVLFLGCVPIHSVPLLKV